MVVGDRCIGQSLLRPVLDIKYMRYKNDDMEKHSGTTIVCVNILNFSEHIAFNTGLIFEYFILAM